MIAVEHLRIQMRQKTEILGWRHLRHLVDDHGEFSVDSLRVALAISGLRDYEIDGFCTALEAEGWIVPADADRVRLSALGIARFHATGSLRSKA